MRSATRRFGVAVTIATVLLVGCAPDSSNATPIAVDLVDDRVTLSVAQAPSGAVTFDVHNSSTDVVHEIEVFAGAREGAALSVNNAVADVTALDLVDEVEDIVPGSGASLTVAVEPGTYLVMCNLPGHYENGMWAYLTVTAG